MLSEASTVRTAPVAGGELAYEVLAGSTEPVLAIHGISSTRKLFGWLHAAAPDLTLITPDLRGRADSVAVQGTSSIAQHTADMVRLLDHLGLAAVHVCGMSMGGFVAVELAARYPGRVRSLVLVDGGFRLNASPGMTREMLPAVFADRLGRLQHRWASLDEYLDFFVANTTPLLDRDDPQLRRYLEHDLRDGAVRVVGDALLSDAEDVYFSDHHWLSVTQPIRFLYAEWSTGPGSRPAYGADQIGAIREKTVAVTFLEGHDHAGTIMTPIGARAVGALIRGALA